jgi:hypothetical protein
MKTKIIMSPDGGIKKNVPKNLVPDNSWTDGNNVRFGNGFMEKVKGWQKWNEQELDGAVMALENYYKFAGDDWLIAITPTTVYRFNPTMGTFIDITDTNLTGTTENPVMTENAQDLFIITNGVDNIQYWDGALDYIAPLPNMDDCEPYPLQGPVTDVKAKCLLYFNNQLILGGTTENGESYPQRIRTSQMGDVTAWKNNVDGSGECFVGDLTDGVDWIIRLLPFKNYVVVYKERSIQVLSYVGGDLVWDKWPSVSGVGLLAPKAVIDMGDEHLFLGPDNFYSFNFQEVLEAGDDIKDDFFRLLDPEKSHLVNAFIVEEMTEAWFNFVSINSPDGFHDMAVVYNYDKKTWAFRDLPFTSYGYYRAKNATIIDDLEMEINAMDWELDTSKYLANAPINLCGSAQGFIYLLDGNSKDGADINGWAVTKVFDGDNPMVNKRWKGLRVFTSYEGNYSLVVHAGMQKHVDSPVTWYGPYYYLMDGSQSQVYFDHTAPFATFKLGTISKDQPFKLIGYAPLFDYRGKF